MILRRDVEREDSAENAFSVGRVHTSRVRKEDESYRHVGKADRLMESMELADD